MSYIFDVDDQTVWSPALRVGQLFTHTAENLARLLGCQTGLAPVANDMSDLDLQLFEPFAHKVFDEYCTTTNTIYRELLRSVLAPALVMLQRAGRTLPATTPQHQSFIDSLDQYARSMPT
ncbi:hypothetical protein GCM10011581_48290 [Saccharopolyspora subtropica]|uniref:Uncharacterized protein n=1 Tax=Saccharopolyspora thermophila TaxID=89367 RepID=A0A917K9N5_9PSEU|nr:DUF6086 family protein [Saccharopolyspora subtropica]GGJ05527.1 hypothetical protein GCM10011581_48290 [Saccharopolyspora subtropica]